MGIVTVCLLVLIHLTLVSKPAKVEIDRLSGMFEKGMGAGKVNRDGLSNGLL